MAQVIRYLDPDAPGPTHDGTSWNDAYLSLSAWDAGEATDLVSDGDYHTVYCRSSGGTSDSEITADLSGWTTDSTHYIEIIGADFPSDGIWDDGVYRRYSAGTAISVQTDFVKIRNMQIHCHEEAVDKRLRGIAIENVSASSVIEIDSSLIRCTGTAGGNSNIGINQVGTGTTYVYNSVFIDWGPYRAPAIGGSWSVFQNNASGTMYVYNCTVFDTNAGLCNAGIYNKAGTMTVKNTIVHSGQTGKDFVGTITVENCCSDDGTGSNAQTPSGGDWDNEFTDKDNLDFSLLSGGNCVNNGTDNPGGGLYSDDIRGKARS